MKPPVLTVAVLSWNRLHYLKATLLSAKRCIRHPRIEWIVSDNASQEPGLREFVESLDWVDHKWSKIQSHAAAMNEIVERAQGDYVLLWPEDVQFVVEGDWMERLLGTLDRHPEIGSVGLNFLRRKTYQRLTAPPRLGEWKLLLSEMVRRRTGFRRNRRISEEIDLYAFGWRLPGIVGSGIPSLTRRDYWRRLGPWKTKNPGTAKLIDSSLGAEDDMIQRYETSGQRWQQAMLMKPVAADIINDDIGCKAKVRAGKRYGLYRPPVGDFYYEVLREQELPGEENGLPLSFEKSVRPIGFQLPLDEKGDLLKASMNMSHCEEIVPS